MSATRFPEIDAAIVADDGDAFTFCSTCAFSRACLSQGMDKAALRDLHLLVEHVGPLHAGNHVILGRLQRYQNHVGTVEAGEQVLVGRALDIDENDFALLLMM